MRRESEGGGDRGGKEGTGVPPFSVCSVMQGFSTANPTADQRLLTDENGFFSVILGSRPNIITPLLPFPCRTPASLLLNTLVRAYLMPRGRSMLLTAKYGTRRTACATRAVTSSSRPPAWWPSDEVAWASRTGQVDMR